MNKLIKTALAAVAIIISFAALVADAAAAPVAAAEAAGDFGPPRGRPIKAMLTSPPNDSPPTTKKNQARTEGRIGAATGSAARAANAST